jgi:hypothetical protein
LCFETQLFLVLPKFDRKKIFQKFEKKMVQERWNHYKMLKEIDFWPSAGRESLWTTGEKVGFTSKSHCEVQKQPNLYFSFRGLNLSPLLKSNLHMKSDVPELWGQFNKTYSKFKIRGQKRTLFGPSTSLRLKNCRISIHGQLKLRYPSQLWSHLSQYP